MHEVSVIWFPPEWYEDHPSRSAEVVDLGHGLTRLRDEASHWIESQEEWEEFLQAEHPSDWLELATGVD